MTSASTASSEHGGDQASWKSSEEVDGESSAGLEFSEAAQAPPQQPPPPPQHKHEAEEGRTGDVAEAEQNDSKPTLRRDGPQRSLGSATHNAGQCIPCAFYCFKRQGCGKGVECAYCHMDHTSNKKLRQQAWRRKKQEQEKRGRKQLSVKDEEQEEKEKVKTSTSSVEVVAVQTLSASAAASIASTYEERLVAKA